MHRVKVWALRLGALAVLVGAWFYATGPGEVSALVLPPLPDVLTQFFQNLGESQTYSDALITLSEIVLGFLIAVGSGLAVGFWCARNPVRVLVYERLLAWGYMVPLLLFYPLFITWFGIGPTSKTMFAAVTAFFPMAFNTLRGFQTVESRYLLVARAFRASSVQTDLLVKYHAALPLVTSGVRIAAALCTTTVILTEMVAAESGLGYELTQASTTFLAARLFAIVLVLFIGVGMLQFVVQRTMRARWSERSDAL
ncbi:ABC transporter permease subunit [Streptomyces sp. NPDC005318]|uniref:ABC transporter permease n=1 Tax=Streptomyces sp. NPDC005318 TaxID=3157031 RepID=UPI0033ACE229